MILHINGVGCLQILKADRYDFILKAMKFDSRCSKISLNYKSTLLIKIIFQIARFVFVFYRGFVFVITDT
jgi:hypothetical protein